MLIQSTVDEIELLPALPAEWPDGEIKGALTRCGVTVNLNWSDGKPVNAELTASRDTEFTLKYKDKEWPIVLKNGQEQTWEVN
jgi:alpha-L-fucosidase 2